MKTPFSTVTPRSRCRNGRNEREPGRNRAIKCRIRFEQRRTKVFSMSQSKQGGDQVALDFTRAGIDAARQRVSQFSLKLVLGHVSVAAVDLHGILAAFDPALADMKLG